MDGRAAISASGVRGCGPHLSRRAVVGVGCRLREVRSDGSFHSRSRPSPAQVYEVTRQAQGRLRRSEFELAQPKRSRSAENRSSTTSPLSGSNTAARNAPLWMSIAAYSIMDL